MPRPPPLSIWGCAAGQGSCWRESKGMYEPSSSCPHLECPLARPACMSLRAWKVSSESVPSVTATKSMSLLSGSKSPIARDPSRYMPTRPGPRIARTPSSNCRRTALTSGYGVGSLDDTLLLVHSERALGPVEDDEHIVPRVRHDRLRPAAGRDRRVHPSRLLECSTARTRITSACYKENCLWT